MIFGILAVFFAITAPAYFFVSRELAEDERDVRRAGGISGRLVLVGEEVLPEPTRLIEVRVGSHPVHPTETAVARTTKSPRKGRRSSRRGSQNRPTPES